jgi:hypothetical protein
LADFSESMGYCGGNVVCGTPEQKIFSYNKRTMDRANGAFLAVVAVQRINKLRVINTLNSSTPVASTNISFIINCLRAHFNFVQ